MKDSGIPWVGEIPADWRVGRIGRLYKHRNTKVSDVDYPPLSVTMQGIVPQLETAAKSDDHDNRKLVKVGDFAINSRSDRRGSCGVSEYDGSVSLINTVLEPRETMSPAFYNLVFHTTEFADEFYKWGHGIVDDLWTTRWQDMKSMMVPVPTIDEQERIALFVEESCAAIDEVKQTITDEIEALHRLRKATIHKAVTKGLDKDAPMRDSGVEWIGEVPAGWKVSQVKRAYSVTLGKMVEKAIDSMGKPTDRYLCAANIGWSGIRTEVHREMPFTSAEKVAYAVHQGDVMVMEGGATAGTTCVYRGEFGNVTYMQNSVMACRKRSGGPSDYLAYWMELVYFSGYRDAVCNAATFAHYTKDKVETTPILILPKVEEKRIVAYLDERCAAIDSIIETRTNQLERLEDYRKALIFAYVTGKKEVPSHE